MATQTPRPGPARRLERRRPHHRAPGADPLPAEPVFPRGPGHRQAIPPLRATAPGALLHVDVKRLGNTPTAAAGATSDAPSGKRNRARSDPYRRAGKIRGPLLGHGFVHTVIDDHSRVVHAEVHDHETAATATAVLRRTVAWFTARGIPTERVLSDNGPPTGRRPAARSNASTAAWPTDGATSAATPQKTNAALPCQHDSPSTTTPDPTPPVGTSHPSHD
jgi:hypothetical protein